MAKRTKKPRAKKSQHEQLLGDLTHYKSLLERAIVAVKVSHAKELRPLGDGYGAWSTRCLEEAILLSHVWPRDDPDEYRRTAFDFYQMERAIPKPLLTELLANPPTEPASKPADDDHTRNWVCFLTHQYPHVESTAHDDLITDETRFRAYLICPVFRSTRAQALLAGRRRARELSQKHGARFTTDCHGRLIVPDAIKAPTRWEERSLGDRKAKRYAIGDIDEYGFQLQSIELTGQRPEDRQKDRWNGDANRGYYFVEHETGTRSEGREVLDVCSLDSTWKWVEPADSDRVPLSRVPIGGIIQLIKRGKPGDFHRRARHDGEWHPDIPFETIVIYRRADALPDTVLETLGTKRKKAEKTQAPASVIARPTFAPDSLFAQQL